MGKDDTPSLESETFVCYLDEGETTFYSLHLGRSLVRVTRLCVFLLALITALSYLARWNWFAELLTHFTAVYFACAILGAVVLVCLRPARQVRSSDGETDENPRARKCCGCDWACITAFILVFMHG